jgi:hypothetical protein
MAGKTKMFPGWYKELRKLSASDRVALLEIVMENIRRGGDLKDRVNAEGDALVKELRRDYLFVGFSPSVMYLKKTNDEATYVHPWGMVTLIFKHKRLPTLLHVNAAMRKDEMLLAKIPFNREVFEALDATGITG